MYQSHQIFLFLFLICIIYSANADELDLVEDSINNKNIAISNNNEVNIQPTTGLTGISTSKNHVDSSSDDELNDFFEVNKLKYDYKKIDPQEEYNKNIFSLNLFLLRNTLLPFIFLTDSWAPKIATKGYTNFINNLLEPRNYIVSVFRHDKEKARKTAKRFFTNSIFGMFGLVNVAELKWGAEYKSKRYSVDCIFRYKGIQPGRYWISPLANQYFDRSFVADIFDLALNPLFYVNFPFNYLLYIADQVILLTKDKKTIYQNRKYSDMVYKNFRDISTYEIFTGNDCL